MHAFAFRCKFRSYYNIHAHHRNFISSAFLERYKKKKTKTRLNTILHLSIISPVPCVSLKTRLVLSILKLVYLCTKRIPKVEICKPAGSVEDPADPMGTPCGVPCGRCRFNLASLSSSDGKDTSLEFSNSSNKSEQVRISPNKFE